MTQQEQIELKHLIGDRWVDGDGARTVPVFEAATGAKLYDGPVASAEVVDAAARAAAEAFTTWGRTTPQQRAECLLALADAFDRNKERFAQLESQNVGKPIDHARQEMPLLTDLLHFFAGAARLSEGGTAGEF